jgi:multicomponent Na+:H+ antiporter subunit D
MNMVSLLPSFVAIPLFTGLILSIKSKKMWYTHFLTLASTFFLSVLAFMNPMEKVYYHVGGYSDFVGITLALDPLSRIILIMVQVLVFLACWYSIGYMDHYTDHSRYYALVFFMLAGMNGILITADFFNLFVFMEIATLASYSLVAYGGKAHELEASFKYLVLGSVSSLFVLFGIALIYSQTAALNMFIVSERLDFNTPIAWLIVVMMSAGLGLKSALFPFHSWLPDAHSSAPAPISAVLSGVLIKAVGIYVILRFYFNIVGIENAPLSLIAWLGALSSLTGVILAMGQHDFKRLLACHSVSQVGYIFIGIGLGTYWGLLGAILHMINHAAFKSLLF